ncbi:FIST N-terminal domain-containing protein [Candidatus Riflebacteria bacterium]
MSIKKGFGFSCLQTGKEAGRLAAVRALQQNPEPDIAIMFASGEFNQEEVFAGVRQKLKRVPIFGSSSPLEISNLGFTSNSVIILLLSSPGLEFSIYSSKCQDEPDTTARYLVSKFLQEKGISEDELISCLLLGTEHHVKGFKYLTGMNEQTPYPIPVSGGGSLGKFCPEIEDNLSGNFLKGYQYCDRFVATESLSLLFIKARKEGNFKFSYAYESNWSPIAPTVVCTKADHNCVFEVDGQPILAYLEKDLGQNLVDLANFRGFKFTFIAKLKGKNEEKSVIRSPWVDLENGCVNFFPHEDMQGMEIQAVYLSRDELLKSASTAAEKALTALDGHQPEVVFLFNCHLISRLLHSQKGEEVHWIQKVFGKNVPIIGFYAGGEFGPLLNKYEDITEKGNDLAGSRQLSTSISIMVIGSKNSREDGTDYSSVLRKFQEEDKSKEEYSKDRQIEDLTQLLNNAETIISETEKIFKSINYKHYELAQKIKQQYQELLKAQKRNDALQKIIRHYTPHKVWDKAQVSVDVGFYQIPDEETFCTLMFLDIKGFTAYAENHSPEEVIKEINNIFSPVTAIIYENDGDIDKFIGDCIFGVFDYPDDAFQSALAIQEFMQKRPDTGPSFSLRIGINSGRVISGNVGGEFRRDNTLIGDAVNLSQRLESNCTPGAILISKDSFEHLDEELSAGMRKLEKDVQVKGKVEKIRVVEIFPWF